MDSLFAGITLADEIRRGASDNELIDLAVKHRRLDVVRALCSYQGFGSEDLPTGPGCTRPKDHDGPCSTD